MASARIRVDGYRCGRGGRLRISRIIGGFELRMLVATTAVLLLMAGVVQLNVAGASPSARKRIVVELVLQAKRLLDTMLQVIVLH